MIVIKWIGTQSHHATKNNIHQHPQPHPTQDKQQSEQKDRSRFTPFTQMSAWGRITKLS